MKYLHEAINEFIKLNRLNPEKCTGYEINVKTDTIKIKFPFKTLKVGLWKLEQLKRILDL